MLRSLYSAVSGIKGHQTYLDVTGNNIANVNTAGFKKDSLLFADAIYQTMKGASAPNAGVPIGGVNPAQVGLGVTVAAIETIHSQGSMQNTGQSTDMAIEGKGFFVMKNGTQQLYTRSGAFSLDKQGNLVQQGTGYMVQGYSYTDRLNPQTGIVERVKDATLGNINIPIGDKLQPKATQLASFRCNLCSTEDADIMDLANNIPGGTERVKRPHEYTAYGSPKQVTYVAAAPGAVTGTVGEVRYNTTDGTLHTYDGTNWVQSAADANTIYYGPNATSPLTAGNFTNTYVTGDRRYIGPVASKVTVDQAGAGIPLFPAPATVPAGSIAAEPSKPGATYLNTATGVLYTANATGDGWLPTTSTVKGNTVYAVKNSNPTGTPAVADLYRADGMNPVTVPMTALPALAAPATATGVTPVMDPLNANNLFRWNGGTDDTWANVNFKNADGSLTSLFASDASATTQATIDAFGESIFASHDHPVKMSVYDSLGNPQTLEVFFRRVFTKPADPKAVPPTAAETEWDWYACYTDTKGERIESYGEGAGTLVFGDDGLLKRTYYYEPVPLTPDPAATGTTQPEYNWEVREKIIDQNDPRYNASIHDSIATGKVVADFNLDGAEGTVDGQPPAYASNTITLDFLGKQYADLMGVAHEAIDGVTSFASVSTTKMRYQDGYPMGILNDWSTSMDGTITGIYSNNQLLPIGQVALATFQNDAGLTKVGGTYFAESANSGIPEIGGAMEGSAGNIKGMNLEMSNVDLSEEFVNLIRAQRGFQANSRVVTTSDQVLEELINLKR